MTIAREQIFGPVAAVVPFAAIGEAVDIANDSIFGLAAGIWTSNRHGAQGGARHRCRRDLGQLLRPTAYDPAPGGFKQSGTGPDKCLETLLTVTQTKSVWIDLGG